MKKHFWRVVGRIVGMVILTCIVATVIRLGQTTEDYGMVCTRCLQQKYVVDKFIFGFRYSHIEKLVTAHEPLWLAQGNGSTSANPETYDQIFGRSCDQHFVRYGGFGRESGGMISDGQISQPPALSARLALIGRLFEVFSRAPNQASAREAYSMIDEAYPENLGWNFTCNMPSIILAPVLPDDPMSILYRGLHNVKTQADWQTVIKAAKAHDGNIALLKD